MTLPADSHAISETVQLIVSGVLVTAVLAFIAFSRRILRLPKQMQIVMGALFRLLGSNQTQGEALKTIAGCQKTGKCNGDTDDAIKAVLRDQKKIDAYFRHAAMGQPVDEKQLDDEIGE